MQSLEVRGTGSLRFCDYEYSTGAAVDHRSPQNANVRTGVLAAHVLIRAVGLARWNQSHVPIRDAWTDVGVKGVHRVAHRSRNDYVVPASSNAHVRNPQGLSVNGAIRGTRE